MTTETTARAYPVVVPIVSVVDSVDGGMIVEGVVETVGGVVAVVVALVVGGAVLVELDVC
jgi:hypothetical protein